MYPLVLAGLMKVLPFHYPLDLKKRLLEQQRKFLALRAGFFDCLVQRTAFAGGGGADVFLARKLFDTSVAWLSAILVLGCELLWRFSVSGLSTMLLLVIFLGLTWCILRIEEAAREPQPQFGRLLGLAIAAGVVTGVGALTRYAFGWVIIPVAVFLILFGGPATGVARAGGVGRVRAGADALGHPQFRRQRHAVRHGGFCGG